MAHTDAVNPTLWKALHVIAKFCVVCYCHDFCRYGVKKNLVVDNVEEVIDELKLFKLAGGGTVCDVSPVGVRSALYPGLQLSLALTTLSIVTTG